MASTGRRSRSDARLRSCGSPRSARPRLGEPPLGTARVGGASDGNFTGAIGVPNSRRSRRGWRRRARRGRIRRGCDDAGAVRRSSARSSHVSSLGRRSPAPANRHWRAHRREGARNRVATNRGAAGASVPDIIWLAVGARRAARARHHRRWRGACRMRGARGPRVQQRVRCRGAGGDQRSSRSPTLRRRGPLRTRRPARARRRHRPSHGQGGCRDGGARRRAARLRRFVRPLSRCGARSRGMRCVGRHRLDDRRPARGGVRVHQAGIRPHQAQDRARMGLGAGAGGSRRLR